MTHASYLPEHGRPNGRPVGLGLWRVYILGVGLLSLAAAGWIFLGMNLSGFRLALVGVFGLAAILALAGAAHTWLRPVAAGQFWAGMTARLQKRSMWNLAFIIASLLVYLSLILVTTYPDLKDDFVQVIFSRLLPLAAWLAGVCLLSLGLLLALRYGRGVSALRPHGRLFYLLLAYYAVMLVGWGWVTRSVLESESRRVGWNALGTPITGLQLFLAWLLGLVMLVFFVWQARAARRMNGRWLDIALALLIWAVAVLLWQSTPMPPNWFVTTPTYPNFEYYPGSDARAYDTSAQTALIGEGYRFYNSVYVRRSLLAAWITVFHLVGGQAYDQVVLVQILLLALIPVLLYFITCSLLNRAAGVIAAALLILRQANAIAIADTITTSNAKLIMADLPSALVAMAFTLLAILWLKRLKGGLYPALALATGGMLGFAMLIRMEMIMFSPAVALAAIFTLAPRKLWARLVSGGLLAALGVGLVLAPWVLRNYRLTGQVFVDSPYFSAQLLIQRFHPGKPADQPIEQDDDGQDNTSPTPEAAPANKVQPALAPGDAQPPAPQPTPRPLAPSGLEQAEQTAVNYMTRNVGKLAEVALAHILNSQMQAFLYLPNSYRGLDAAVLFAAHRLPAEYWANCCSLENLPRRLPFWKQWDGRIPGQASLPLLLNLLLVAYGANLAWKRWRWAGLMPLMMGLIFIVFNGLLRNSGGRYMLPIDWITLVYFSIGLAEAARGGLAALSGRTIPDRLPGELDLLEQLAPARRLSPGIATALAALGLALLAAGIPLLEVGLPKHFTPEREKTLLHAALASPQLDAAQRQALETYLANGAQVLSGRALYPRYFPPNVGDDVAKRSPLSPRPYPRMVFYLAGEKSQNVMLPLEGKPDAFPHALDALVIACPERDLLVTFLFSPSGELQTTLLRAPFPQQMSCPLPQDR